MIRLVSEYHVRWHDLALSSASMTSLSLAELNSAMTAPCAMLH